MENSRQIHQRRRGMCCCAISFAINTHTHAHAHTHTHTHTHTEQSLDGLLSLKVMLIDGYQWWIVPGYQLFGGELSLVIGYSVNSLVIGYLVVNYLCLLVILWWFVLYYQLFNGELSFIISYSVVKPQLSVIRWWIAKNSHSYIPQVTRSSLLTWSAALTSLMDFQPLSIHFLAVADPTPNTLVNSCHQQRHRHATFCLSLLVWYCTHFLPVFLTNNLLVMICRFSRVYCVLTRCVLPWYNWMVGWVLKINYICIYVCWSLTNNTMLVVVSATESGGCCFSLSFCLCCCCCCCCCCCWLLMEKKEWK